MKLVTWNEPRSLFNVNSDFDRLVDRFFGNTGRDLYYENWAPAADFSETADTYEIHADLPGLNKDDIKITLHENVLTITGERKEEKREDNKNYHCIERTSGSFSRSFRLPKAGNQGDIKAEYKDGVLAVTVPKAEDAKPRQIEVK